MTNFSNKIQFKSLLIATGLSQAECGFLLEVDKDTIRNYCNLGGETTPTNAEIATLSNLVETIQTAADNWAENFDMALENGQEVEIGISVDDHEAQQRGFPFLSAERAAIGLSLQGLEANDFENLIFVPRGSTPGTAAAERAHNKKR